MLIPFVHPLRFALSNRAKQHNELIGLIYVDTEGSDFSLPRGERKHTGNLYRLLPKNEANDGSIRISKKAV